MKPVQMRRSMVATARLAAIAAIIVVAVPPVVCFSTGYLVHASTAQSIADSTAWWMSEHIALDGDRLPAEMAPLLRSRLPPDRVSGRTILNAAGEVLFEAQPGRPLVWLLLQRTAHVCDRALLVVRVP